MRMGNKSAERHSTPEAQRRASNETEWARDRPPVYLPGETVGQYARRISGADD